MDKEESIKTAALLVVMYGEFMQNLSDRELYAEVGKVYSRAVAEACMALGTLGREVTP